MTTENAPRIKEFADAVRAALSDLTPDDILELTEGLESDLTDQAADPGAQPLNLDDAVAYANELRAAAGLPAAATTAGSRRSVRDLGQWARETRAHWAARIRASTWGNGVLSFLVALRPVWWVLRGTVVFSVILFMAEAGGFVAFYNGAPYGPWWVLWLACVVLSVQWGRGQWMPWRWQRGFLAVVSVCTILALPAVIGISEHSFRQPTAWVDDSESIQGNGSGLWSNDTQVLNIFAYDEEGTPLDNVRLFDDRGRPLVTTTQESFNANGLGNTYFDGGMVEYALVAYSLKNGYTGWNVYPMGIARLNGYGEKDAPEQKAIRPFGTLKPLSELTALDNDTFSRADDGTVYIEVPESTSEPTPTGTTSPSAEPTPSSTTESEDNG